MPKTKLKIFVALIIVSTFSTLSAYADLETDLKEISYGRSLAYIKNPKVGYKIVHERKANWQMIKLKTAIVGETKTHWKIEFLEFRCITWGTHYPALKGMFWAVLARKSDMVVTHA